MNSDMQRALELVGFRVGDAAEFLGLTEEEGRIVRRCADELPETTPEELARVRALMEGPIDTSDIPETGDSARRVRRDASGRLLPTEPNEEP